MALVWASDVVGGDENGNRVTVAKRGDKVSKGQVKELFGFDDPQEAIDNYLICDESRLPENLPDSISDVERASLAALEAVDEDEQQAAAENKAAADAEGPAGVSDATAAESASVVAGGKADKAGAAKASDKSQ